MTGIPADQGEQPLMLFRHAVLLGLSEHRRTEGRKQSKAHNLLERMRDREEEILRFSADLSVPPTRS